MTADPSVFDSNLADWKRDEETPWGRLRRSIALRNLTRHLPPPGADILDVGGGNARDSIPLAKIGHRVTVVDWSSRMLADARETARQEEIPRGSLTLKKAALGAIPDLFDAASHDVVLLHNVLSYVEDAAVALEAATYSLKPSGILSLMQVNRYSEALNAAVRDGDLDAALSRLDTGVEPVDGGLDLADHAGRQGTLDHQVSVVLEEGTLLGAEFDVAGGGSVHGAYRSR